MAQSCRAAGNTGELSGDSGPARRKSQAASRHSATEPGTRHTERTWVASSARAGSKWLNLRLRMLWLRHSYTFRWAHRPLCSRFSNGILRMGPMRLCRSCVCLYCGIVFCTILCVCLTAVRGLALPLLLSVTVPTIALSAPAVYMRWARPLRDCLRFCMGCSIALCACAVLEGHLLVAVACASVMLAFWRVYFAARRRRRAAACEGCPELGQRQVCTGCVLQAAGIRAYETEATEILLACGTAPRTPGGKAS